MLRVTPETPLGVGEYVIFPGDSTRGYGFESVRGSLNPPLMSARTALDRARRAPAHQRGAAHHAHPRGAAKPHPRPHALDGRLKARLERREARLRGLATRGHSSPDVAAPARIPMSVLGANARVRPSPGHLGKRHC
jgi:hypothetical protein